MSVKYAGGGGGSFWNILGTLASAFIPGAGPYIAGANLLRSALSGKPEDAAMQAVGMVAPGKVTKSEGITPSAGGGVGVATPEMSLSPDATDRMQMNKELRAQQVAENQQRLVENHRVDSRYNELASKYGGIPDADVSNTYPSRWTQLLTRYPSMFGR